MQTLARQRIRRATSADQAAQRKRAWRFAKPLNRLVETRRIELLTHCERKKIALPQTLSTDPGLLQVISKYTNQVGPRATWVKVDDWGADPVTTPEPASGPETGHGAGREQGPVSINDEGVAQGDDSGRSSDSDPGNPPPDVDEWVWRQICERRGQQAFRRNLLAAYECQCAITKCRVEAALEAAHLAPHSDESNYEVTIGIILRADVHTLFDLHLVSIDPDTMFVRLHPTLLESYDGLDSKPVHLPAAASQHPDVQRLRDHFEQWRLVAGVETEPADSPL